MIIKSIKLRNFKSHSNTKIDFERGISIIVGENGAGKTSILEAISFVLFKDFTGGIDDLIRRGSGELEVELEFTHDRGEYKVCRKKRKNIPPESRLYAKSDGFLIIQEGDRNVTEEIRNILQMDDALFMNAVYIRQGEIAKLLDAIPSKRKEIIGKLLGIDALQRAWNVMPEIISDYKDKKIRIDGELERKKGVEEGLEHKKKELDAKRADKGGIERNIGAREEDARRLKGENEEYDKKREVFLQFTEKLKHRREILGHKQRRVREVENQLKDINESEGEIKKLEPVIGLLPVIQKFTDMNKGLDRIEKNMMDSGEKIKRLDGEISGILGNASSLLKCEVRDIAHLEEVIMLKKEDAGKELERTEKNLTEKKDAASDLNARNKNLDKAICELKKAAGRCPVCDAELTEERRIELLNGYELEKTQNDLQIRKLRSEVDELESKRTGLSDTAHSVDKIPVDLLESKLRDKSSETEAVKECLEKAGKIKEEINNLKVDFILPGEYMEEKLDSLQRSRDRYNELLGVIKNKDNLSGELSDLGGDISGISKEIEELTKNINEIRYSEESHSKIKNLLEESLEELNSLVRKMAGLDKEIEILAGDTEDMKKELGELKLKEIELKKLEGFISFLHGLRGLFDKDGLQKELRVRSKPMIEKFTRDIFGGFNMGCQDISIGDEYDITMYYPDGEKSIDMISGGEKIAASLALRLGIAKVLSGGRSELMILDEPTIHLDEIRRRELIDIIRKIPGAEYFPQIIIVTHDEDFENAADSILRVRKENGISLVEKYQAPV